MAQQRFTTQGNMSYLPWVAPVNNNADSEDLAPHEHILSIAGATEVLPLVEDVNEAELFNEVKNWALRALGRKDYSRKDLKRYLSDRLHREKLEVESAAALCEEVLDQLEAESWLDEQRAIEAQLLKSQYRDLGFRGKKQRLQQQGYTEEAILAVLKDESSDDEFERLLELTSKRAGQLHDLDFETARRRLSGYLLRRGYSGSEVAQAISKVLSS